jgi:hypothetical protein
MRHLARFDRHDRSNLGFPSRAARCGDWQVGENPRRSWRQQEHAVTEPNRVVNVVGNQQGHHGTAVHQHGYLFAQASGEGFVERCQRLVENEEIRLNCERAGERDAPGEAKR